MAELVTLPPMEWLGQAFRDHNGILLPVLAIALTAALLWTRSRSRAGAPNEGLLARGGRALTAAFATNWQLTLLATTAFVLSLASGWTTWDGMRNFTGEPILALMVTFGIQGVMIIIAWLIGESFAQGMNQQRQRARFGERTGAWSKIEPALGLLVGSLFAFTLFVAAAKALGAFDSTDAPGSVFNWSAVADKAIYLGVGLLLIATLLINHRSDIAQPYVQSARIILRSAVLWVMFLACAATSVFFSFDSLFSSIFTDAERRRTADIRAVNQVAGIVADVGGLMHRRQAEEADALFKSEGWRRYDDNLAQLARESQGAERLIEDYFVQQMEARRRAVAEQQERIASAMSGQAGLSAKKGTMTDELSRLRADRPELAGALARVKSELDERARGLDAKRIEAQAEEKGAEGTLKVGRGPQWRERTAELARMQEAYKIQEERVRDAQKRLANVDQRVAQLERELAAVDGDMGKLKGEAQTAEARIQGSQPTTVGSDGKVDPARIRASFERARAEFVQDPTVERLTNVTQQCSQLLAAMSAAPATREKVRSIDCDPKPASEAAARVFALNAGIDLFARSCSGGDKLPQTGGTDALLSFGRRCLQDSGLQTRDSAAMAAKISALDLNRDDKAHRFVVMWNAFQDGNRLAYLALAIAVAIDSLIFMSGLFGANAVRSPLTDLEGRGELSAEQLEAAIDHTLAHTAHPRATLAVLLRSMHPVQGEPGFSSEIILDNREALVDEMRAVLVAGATIGAVRRVGDDRARYLVSTGLARYFAVAQRKAWKVNTIEVSRKELINIVGVALAPDPQGNAEAILGELHPISDAPGYAAETYPFRIAAPRHRRLMLNVLGAGATVEGAVQRTSGDDGRYFVSTDLYKTLLMMSAGAFPQHISDPSRIAQVQASRHAVQALRAETIAPGPEPRRLSPPAAGAARSPPSPASEMARSEPHLEERPPDPARHRHHDGRPRGAELQSSLRNQIRDELIQLGGLFPWDAREVAIAARLEEDSEPEAALKRLSHRAPQLSDRISKVITDCRNGVHAAYQELHARYESDPLYLQVLETVAGELVRLMPLLILAPKGPYQQELEQMITQLEPQSGDGALSAPDQVILDRAKQQVVALERLADDGDRLHRVAAIIDLYDEQVGPAQSAHG